MKIIFIFLILGFCSGSAPGQSLTPINAPFIQGQPVRFSYSGGTGSPTDWIGIYKTGQVPGSTPSTVWQYIPASAGQVEFEGNLAPGYYDAHLFCCDGYNILASFTNFLIAGEALRSRLSFYKATDSLRFTSFGSIVGDLVGIYHAADFSNGNLLPNAVPVAEKSITSVDINNESTLTFSPLPVSGAFVGVLSGSGHTIKGFDLFEVRPSPVMPPVITRFGLGSCGQQTAPQPALENLLQHNIDFFLYLGDNLYIDTYDAGVMRNAYENFITGREEYQQVRSTVPVLAIWDDHDYGCCDEDGDYPLKAVSQQIFLDFFEEPADSPRRTQEGIYTAYTFGDEGQRLQVILLDTRYFEDDKRPNNGCGINDYCPWDSASDAHRTILGDTQWAWLKTRLEEPADLRIVASSVQFSSSYHGFESWRLFPHQRKKFQELIRETGAEHLFFVSGDMHYSEVSRLDDDPDLYPIYDFTSSSINSSWPPEGNQNRVPGKVYGNDNSGLIDIDWQEKTVRFTCLDASNAVRYEHTVTFDEMEFDLTPASEAAETPQPVFLQAPSPGKGAATLIFEKETSGELFLFDLTGRIRRKLRIEHSGALEISNLPAGIYMAEFRGASTIAVLKILVQ